MEEAIYDYEDHPVADKKEGKLVFRYFPGYAAFIRDNCLVPYIAEQLRICRQIELPMMKFLEGMTDDQLITMGLESHKMFLTSAEENTLAEHLEKSLKAWVEDQLLIMKREDLTAEDISYAGFVRKKALMKFLPSYTTDLYEAIEIINEIDRLGVYNDIASTNVYIKLLQDRIKEQVFLTEALSNTTPGINFIFGLGDRSLVYANGNAERFFGNTLEDMKVMKADFLTDKLHHEDVAETIAAFDKCAAAKNGEVVTWEMRLKAGAGHYVWMRNYSSVYKRNDDGTVSQIVGIILDIDKEREVSEQLLKNERQLLDAQEQAEVGSFELDVATGKMEVTPQFKKIYEVTDFDLYTLIDNVHPEDRERVNANRDKAIRENGIYDNEYRYRVNGKEKVIWSRGRIADRNGTKIMVGTVMDITARHQMLQQLRESDERFKQAQARTHIGNWTWDIVNDKVSWSDEMFRIYGLEPQSQEVNYDTYISHIHPDDQETRKAQVQRVFETGEPEDHHYRIVAPDGSVRILHTKSEIEFDKEGKPLRMMGTCQDITEKQTLIDRLQRSEVLYKQAQAISHIGNWSWNVETKEMEWSDELYRIYELEPNSAGTSDTIALYNHPQDEELIRNTIRNARSTLQPFDINFRIILNDHRIKTLNLKGEVAADADGKAVKIYGTVQDITEQKLVEKKLKDSQDFIRKITDVTPSVIAAYDVTTGQFSFINDAIEKQLGYESSRVFAEGVPFFISITHPDDLPGLMEKNAKALEEANQLVAPDNEPIAEFKYRMKNVAGEYRWFHTFGTIFERDEHNQVKSVLNISIDVTDQELAEQGLFQKNLELQQSNTSLEEYAYVASHDLKEPLRKIVTFSDRIVSFHSDTLNEDAKLYLGKVIESSKRMQKMINDLLYVSTIAGNKDFQLYDLNFILSEALQPLDHKIEEIKAIVDSDTLPTALVVPSQFIQLFQNLIGNALKFVRKDVVPKITITHSFIGGKALERHDLSKAKRYLKIEVQDNGIGFDNQYANRIFAIFQRLHGRTEYEGTGIGLAVCKKIVENHGGAIYADGKLNEGARFVIVIPV